MNQHLTTAVEVTAQLASRNHKSGMQFRRDVEHVTGLDTSAWNEDSEFIRVIAIYIDEGFSGLEAIRLARSAFDAAGYKEAVQNMQEDS